VKIPFTGGCMCGAIRYECSAEPIFMGNCHCRDCQQATGTAYAAAILVPRDAVSIAGDVKYYDVKGGSGNIISRGFCPNCGSRYLGIMAGSIDDPAGFSPTFDFHVASAQPWDYMNPELPKFAKSPSSE
jgi:hypothetical protein